MSVQVIRRFEFVGEGSMKFWEIDTHSGATRYGRIGSAGSRAMTSPRHVMNKINEKLRKGYVEVTGNKGQVFMPGDLVRFRNDDADRSVRRWLEHSTDTLIHTDHDSTGTVLGVIKKCPTAPNWTLYEVTAGAGIRKCAGVYMEKIQ